MKTKLEAGAGNVARHTVGRWIVDRDGMGELAPFSAKGKHLLHSGGKDPLPLEEREANGELIAAAPELLAALRKCVTWANLYGAQNFIGDNGPFAQDMREAAAVIAKAGGAK